MLQLTWDKPRVFANPQGPRRKRRAGCRQRGIGGDQHPLARAEAGKEIRAAMRDKNPRRAAVAARCLGAALLVALLAACPPEARTIAPQDLVDYLEKGKVGRAFNLVDLRPEEAYAGQHLPGAINIPYERLAADRLLFLDGLPVIFYDEAEPDLTRLRNVVGARLPSHVVVLEGGFRGWVAARLPVTRGT
jgi:rhodanese-related sulfurtransferase